MNLRITNAKGAFDITTIVPSVKWSGDYQQAARSLDFSLLSSPTDKNVPVVDCPPGTAVQMIENNEILFDGFVATRMKNTESSLIESSCFDRGLYLKQNKKIYSFSSTTPEAATRQIAADFNIKIGYLAPTNVPISRIFLSGKDSLYDIILTMYNLAAKTTKSKYHIGFRGESLYITVKEPDARTLIIKGKSNLIAANISESIADMVNAVEIYDTNGKFVREVKDDALIKLYGRMQESLKQTKTDNKAADAQKLLDDGGMSQKITVDSFGNIANVTGGTVVVQEPHTGVCGLFYIDGDSHEWKRGQYYNKLVLNFKNIMNPKEAGEMPNATGSNTASSSTTSWARRIDPLTGKEYTSEPIPWGGG